MTVIYAHTLWKGDVDGAVEVLKSLWPRCKVKSRIEDLITDLIGQNFLCIIHLGVRINYCYCLSDVVSFIFPNCLACGIP